MKRRLGIAAAFLVLVLATGAATWAQAQTFTVLHSFTNSPDGAVPFAAMIMDKAGNLYGTTAHGGSGGSCSFGCGTVFKLDTSGNETVLHSFTGGSDGFEPLGGLIMDTAGNLYGTTENGGSGGSCSFGCGTVFKLDTSGNETVLHSFTNSPDGAFPFFAGLLMDAAGNVYGTTFSGGVFCCGTVFKLDASGNETVLHSFTGGSDGDGPVGGLLMDAAGNIFGTTQFGGSSNCLVGSCGTVFKLDASGNETVLHSFTGGSDGFEPGGGLIMDAAGNIFGTSILGGSGPCTGTVGSNQVLLGCGIVFKLDTSGNETVLHSFTGGNDGAFPEAGLVMDTAGNLYGTTAEGGGSGTCTDSAGNLGCGTVFKLDTSGNETVLHSFTNSPGDGIDPFGALIMDAAGNLYGTTSGGGVSGFGTVFKLTVLTPQQATQAIINAVNALFSQGVLNGGQDNSLVVKLQHAIDRMNAGNDAAAIGNLNAFIGEVNDLLSSGVLSPSQAASLVSAAESVIAAL